MNQHARHWAQALGGLLPLAAGAAAPPTDHVTDHAPVLHRWSCPVAYLPARSTWVREVALLRQADRITQVLIDGQPVYSWNVQGTSVATALDNERIRFDTAALSWQSDFRGHASGQGRCEPLP